MEIQISAKHMDLTDALKNHIEERMTRIKKYTDVRLTADIHLGVEKYRHHIHATVKGNGSLFNSEAEDTESMYKAIDLCVDKLEKQLRRDKKGGHHEKGSGKSTIRQSEVESE